MPRVTNSTPPWLLMMLITWSATDAAGQKASFTRPEQFISQVTGEIRSATADSLKIEKLLSLARYYSDYLGDIRMADSTGDVAVGMAERTYNPGLIFAACNHYLENTDLRLYHEKALAYARRAEEAGAGRLKADDQFRLYLNRVALYLAVYDHEQALGDAYRLLSLAGNTDDPTMKVRSYLAIGQCLEAQNRKIDAFRNYLNAAGIAEKTGDPGLEMTCDDQLSEFFNLIRDYPKATQYKLAQRELLLKQVPVDSLALYWTSYDLNEIRVNEDNPQGGIERFTEILEYAQRHGARRLFDYTLALARKQFIESNQIGALYDLYHTRFPGEMERLSMESPALWYRLNAFFYEFRRMPDSAMRCLQEAEKLLRKDPNRISRSNFYYRYGQFLMRNGKQEEAIGKFRQSWDLAREAGYFDFMLASVGQLEKLYAEGGQFREAYEFSMLHKVLSDSINELSKKDQLLAMEIGHETRQREITAAQEHERILHRHNLQYTAITIGILTVFVVLIMLGSLKVPAWIIRMLGFFSFIFLFEFIILIADHKIHDLTHGEPWKVLLIKIGLIAILLPLHHRIEKLVISYLLSHKLIDFRQFPLREKIKVLFHAKKSNTKS